MSASRLVALQEMRRNWLSHEDRLIHIKSTLNTRLPASRAPTSRKQNITKSLEVQLENKALLKKLTERSHLREESFCCHTSLPKSNRRRYYQEHRLRQENEGMYRRLKQTKPMIDLSALRLQRAETEKLLNTISRFGYKGLKPTKTLLRFDMPNNQLKYLSRRKILLEEKMKEEQRGTGAEDRIIQQELAKHNRTQKLFAFFSRFRELSIDGQPSLLKLARGSTSIAIQLKRICDKENGEGELEVAIPMDLFKEKYRSDLDQLVGKIRYDPKTTNFYIL